MHFVELADKLFDEALVEDHVANLLFGSLPDSLWLQKEKLFAANLVFEVLAHEVGKVASNLDLGVLGECSNGMIVDQEVVLHALVSTLAHSQFLVEEFAQLLKQGHCVDLEVLAILLRFEQRELFHLFQPRRVSCKLREKVLHDMHDAEG